MKRNDRVHAVILTVLGSATALACGIVLWRGWDFYATALAERPRHELFRLFRPAGEVSHGLGIVGSLMVLLLLLYSVRKRVRALQRMGSLRTWLRYHIFLGVAGPVLITLHTAFHVGGLVAVSYWSMAAVALSGVFGRYLYQQIPRNVLGDALSESEIESGAEAILVRLTGDHGLGQDGLIALETLALGRLAGRPAIAALPSLPVLNLILARQLQIKMIKYLPEGGQEALDLARRWILMSRRLHLFRQINDLFHYWHVFHKPFAIIMILVMLIHVGVALALGYTWLA